MKLTKTKDDLNYVAASLIGSYGAVMVVQSFLVYREYVVRHKDIVVVRIKQGPTAVKASKSQWLLVLVRHRREEAS